MNWIPLTSEDQLSTIRTASSSRPQIIFKHSTRCSTSSMVWNRLGRGELPGHTDCYFLDLLNYRTISNKVAEDFNVYHESPQVLIIRNGECTYDESHMAITIDDIVANTLN